MEYYQPTISICFAVAVCEAVQRKGLDVEPLLLRARINPELLSASRSRISPHQLSSLIRATMRLTNDEIMAMGSEPIKAGVFALIANQAVGCLTLREAYQNSLKFYNLVTNSFNVRLEEEAGEARFIISLNSPELDPDHLFTEFFFLIWHRFPSWLIGERIQLNKVTWQHALPKHVDEYRFLFPCPCFFDCSENSFSFPSSWLDRPVVETGANLSRYLRRAPVDWFIKPTFYLNYTRQVYEKLDQHDDGRVPALAEVAQKLHLSVRTLRRKLQGEGSSFQQLKDDVRRDKAINLLADQAISVSEVARRVGFTEPAAFIRAFKHWTGLAPGGYRKGVLRRRVVV